MNSPSLAFSSSQKRALDLSSGKIVLAGAGSGKTLVLTHRYIRLLESGRAKPWQILAMTFTRKAAAELESRIYGVLLEKQQHDMEYRERWKQLYEDMAWARIGTIHSIFGGLLRTEAQAAGIDPGVSFSEKGAENLESDITMILRSLAAERHDALRLLLDRIKSSEIQSLLVRIMDDEFLADDLTKAADNPVEAGSAVKQMFELLASHFPHDSANLQLTGVDQYVENCRLLYEITQACRSRMHGEQSVLSFDAIENRLWKLLQNQPEAAARIRRGIRYILVDEFQDTSTVQWETIRLLASDAQGHLLPEKLFLVGDEKQSIYGFRSANVTVVEDARQRMAHALAMSVEEAEKQGVFVNLADNYRSCDSLVHPLNTVFERFMKPKEESRKSFEAAHQALLPHREDRADEPRIHFLFGETGALEEVYAALAKQIDDRVKSERDSTEYSDIAVLLRSRIELPKLEDAFRKCGIPFQVTQAKGFFELQEIRDLFNIISALSDPRDKLAIAGVLKSPVFSFSDPVLALLFSHGENWEQQWERVVTHPEELSFWDLPDEANESIVWGFRFWKQLKQMAMDRPASELLLYALEKGGGLAAYAVGERGQERIGNIFQAINLIRNLQQEGSYTLRKLMVRLDEMAQGAEAAAMETTDLEAGKGVRLMTIHASKGLEFPFVILADPDKKKRSNKTTSSGNLLIPLQPYASLADPALAPLQTAERGKGVVTLHEFMQTISGPAEEEAEEKRLHYVAATRARDELWIVGKASRSEEGIGAESGSPLERWMDAAGIYKSEETGELRSTVPGIVASWLNMEETCERRTGLQTQRRPEELPKLVPDLQAAPQVRLLVQPLDLRLELPVSTFAAMVATEDPQKLQDLVLPGHENLEKLIASGKSAQKGGVAVTGREIGTLVHRLYQRYGPGCSMEQADREIREMLDSVENETEKEKMHNQVVQLLKNGRLLKLHDFSGKIWKELPVLIAFPDTLVQGRIDLLVRRGDEVQIIDYKTNAVAVEDLEDVAGKAGYDHQLQLYGLAVREAWNPASISLRIAWLEPGVWQEIPFRWRREDYQRELKRIRSCLIESDSRS